MLAPAFASAHATPVSVEPHSGAQMAVAPERIIIRFSERLETESSRISVTNEAGERVAVPPAVVGPDAYTLSTPVTLSDGIYIVSWSVVSQDDGHFTKGSFAFSIGSKRAPRSSDLQIVQIASTKEAVAMTVEFVGNALLLGVIVVLYLARGNRDIRRVLSIIAVFGGVIAISGAYAQLWLKSTELAALHGIALREAFSMYIGTAAGLSTVVRGAALGLAGLVAGLSHFRAIRFSALFVGVCVLVFAYFRASISHATANPFFPALSIAVNFIHVIEKDIWFGVLTVVICLAFTRMRDDVLPMLVPRIIRFLSGNLIILTLSATYIIWLHLKSFDNIRATTWGAAFVQLAAAAFVLIAIHTYHVIAQRYRPQLFRAALPLTLAAEMVIALIVIFFSSVVIITSPPSHDRVHAYSERSGQTSVRLERSLSDDDMALLTVEGNPNAPLVIVGDSDGGLQPKLSERFVGGYTFPAALLRDDPRVEVVVPGSGGYDTRVVFAVRSSDFTGPLDVSRSFDSFTLVMLGIGLLGALYALVLVRIANDHRVAPLPRRFLPGVALGIGIAAIVTLNMSALAERSLANPFKAQCEADGNMWHIMQSLRAGVPVSAAAREGCMLQSGQYHFADAREYAYLRSLPPAQVTIDHEQIVAGVPAVIGVRLHEQSGEPALLSVEHEKLLHVIIVAKDMRAFSHIHPDETVSAYAESVEHSSFSLSHVFPEAGTYIVAVDYLHGLTHESRQFEVEVVGAPEQKADIARYYSPATFDGYRVLFEQTRSFVGNDVTLRYTVTKDGEPVTNMEPYLAAAMHIAVVKADRSVFIHGHGEVHPPGYVYAPPKNGVHVHAPPPASFGPTIEAHLTIPEPGFYTAFGEFMHEGKVITTKFSFVVE